MNVVGSGGLITREKQAQVFFGVAAGWATMEDDATFVDDTDEDNQMVGPPPS